MEFKRDLEEIIKRWLFKGKLVVIYGPRQAGKTTISKRIIAEYKDKGAYYDCQTAEVRRAFVLGKPETLLPLVRDKKIVVFDEAQTIQDIGTVLKVFHDTYKDLGVQIVATGSSSFDLANKIIEPMTGRSYEFELLPLSISEIEKEIKIDEKVFEEILLYGSYPAVVAAKTKEEKEMEIKNISTNYLYKDIFVFEAIKKPKALEDIINVLAMQIGQLVSINEISKTVSVSRETVERYIRLLEQSYIIKRVYSFSNNPRTELRKASKIYFIDAGIRNTLVDIKGNLSKKSERVDKGFVFENFFFTELLKKGVREVFPAKIMFWRSREGMEIDFIEKQGPNINAYECKWKEQEVVFTKFLKSYPNANAQLVTPSNFKI